MIEARLRLESLLGFYFDEFESTEANKPIIQRFSKLELTIKQAFVFGKPEPAFSLIIELEPIRFLFIGAGYNVFFASTSLTAVYTDILHAEEKRVVDAGNGLPETKRRLDGDETSSGI